MNTLATKQNETVEGSVPTQTKKEERIYSPNVNIFESKDNVTLLVELPGLDQSSVEVSIEKDTLSIEGSYHFDESNYGKSALQEFRGGKYSRKFTLGKLVDVENAQAKMKNGILELTLQKLEPKKTKIEIQS